MNDKITSSINRDPYPIGATWQASNDLGTIIITKETLDLFRWIFIEPEEKYGSTNFEKNYASCYRAAAWRIKIGKRKVRMKRIPLE